MKRRLPWILTGICALWFVSTMRTPATGDFRLDEFGRLPVVFSGRHQPVDSLARNSLVQIRDRYTVRDAAERRTLGATGGWPRSASNRRPPTIARPFALIIRI